MIAAMFGGLAVATTRTSAAPALALPHSDYPHGASVSAVPATNALVDQYLRPVHRSSFEGLHRIDGAGWLQFGTWHFSTGRGAMKQRHDTIFGYSINLFRTAKSARRALHDVKLTTHPFRVAHIPALRYKVSDIHQTLVFAFFVYRFVEVEAYYEYTGVAPARVSKMLGKDFSRQRSHLVHLARVLSRRVLATATPTPEPSSTPTPIPTPTFTATPTDTATAAPPATDTPVPTATSTPVPTATAASTSTPTPLPTPTATATPVVLAVSASMDQSSYAPGRTATLYVRVTANGQPAAGATVDVTFYFPDMTTGCRMTTDTMGLASCTKTMPNEPSPTHVQVDVSAYLGVQTASTTTAFVVSSP